jgi:excinuclease ABC subunit B
MPNLAKTRAKFQLVAPFGLTGDQPQAVEKLVRGFEAGLKRQVLLGVTGSGKTFTVANVIQRLGRPTLVLSPNKTLAAQLWAEFKQFFPNNAVEYFVSYYDYYQPEAYIPQTDTYIEKDSSRNDEIDRLRNSATRALITRRDVIVVASVSCIYGIGSPEDYLGVSLTLKKGASIRRELVIRKLVDLQHERGDYDFARSSFRVRGDIIDVWPAYEEKALRIEFFGDTIDEIVEFDPLTGEILDRKEEITIFPTTHYVTPEEKLKRALVSIQEELEQRVKEFEKAGRLLEAQRLKQRTLYDLELLAETGTCPGVENYSRHLTGRKPGQEPYTLMDFLPEDALVVVDESHIAVPQLAGMYGGDHSRKVSLVEYGFRLPSAFDNRPLKFSEWENKVNQVLFVSATPGPYEERVADQIVEQLIRPTGLLDPTVEVRPTQGQVDDLINEVKKEAKQGRRSLVTTLTKRFAEDLAEYLQEAELKVTYIHSDIDTLDRVRILRDLRLGNYDTIVGINLLREGLDLPEVSLVVILDADKEGYLRSYRSFIQIMGRAARNVYGRVIMYADKMTESMEKAIRETERRRKIQMEYNEQHGIVPTTIEKAVYTLQERTESVKKEARELVESIGLPYDDIRTVIKDLEREMKRAAKELDFERAALLRDRIFELRNYELQDRQHQIKKSKR